MQVSPSAGLESSPVTAFQEAANTVHVSICSGWFRWQGLKFALFRCNRFYFTVHVQCAVFCLQCFDAVGWVAGRAPGLWKTECWGAGVVIFLERGADLHMAHLMPLLLTVSCFSKIQIGSTFLVPAHLGSPGQRAVKWVCVCVCSCAV